MDGQVDIEEARALLRTRFGHAEFRPGQEEIITALLGGNDILAVLPTGAGKSLCYQLPALLLDGLTIVVTPLIALMQDQVRQLNRIGVAATFINSMLDFRDIQVRLEQVRRGGIQLLYVAPERFESTQFLRQLEHVPVRLFVVDEAHCISSWGHDFRPSYLKLPNAIEFFGKPTVGAFTATATPDVRNDIERHLGLREPTIVIRGFDRPNLTFKVQRGGNKREALLKLCSRHVPAIVYAGTRKTTEELAEFLRRHGISAAAYHAGRQDDERDKVQKDFLHDKISVVCATTAFGMGIDKRNIRLVVHYEMPGSIEQYYQEAGRAGRDGDPALCVMFYSPQDRRLQEYFIQSSSPSKEQVKKVYAFLHEYAGNPLGCEYRDLLPLTAESIAANYEDLNPIQVNSALTLLEEEGYIRRISSSYTGATVRFLFRPQEMREWLVRNAPEELQPVSIALLRATGGEGFFHPVRINLADMAENSFLSEEIVALGLRELDKLGIIEFSLGSSGQGIALITPRVRANSLKIQATRLLQASRRQFSRLHAIEHYCTSHQCRRNLILEYFHETDITGTCGRCDNCTTSARPVDVVEEILERHQYHLLHCVAELQGKFGRTTYADVLRGANTKRISNFRLYEAASFGTLRDYDRQAILQAIDHLIDFGLLERTETVRPSVYLTSAGRDALGVDVTPLSLPRPSEVGELAVTDPELYDALRKTRRRLAQKMNVPSHTMCPDIVLRRLTNILPRTKEECLAVEGMGPATFQRCGNALLQTILDHLDRKLLLDALEKSRNILPDLPASLRATFELVAQGFSLATIAEKRGLTEGTISQHISELMKKGIAIDLDTLVDADHRKAIERASIAVHSTDLKRIKAVVPDDVTYAEIRIVLSALAFAKPTH
ncbi:MAG: RecQ family ATP-dependent DNA helicase [Chlorobi bacterium]|nr:RecQ family ATP-dependent DNA helicase [Chlorobiota bacterium]